MKKLFVMFSLIMVMCLILISCTDTNGIETGANSNISDNGKNATKPLDTTVSDDSEHLNNQDILDTLVPNDNEDLNDQDKPFTIDTSIQVEYDAEREARDNEFPFENIVIERNGYDIVAAGKYYGNDFDNVKYYGSYYRIIDNYEDFSELTQWGYTVDESVFNTNAVLVLHLYKNSIVYNSIKSQKGTFIELKIETNSKEISLIEMWVRNSRAEIIDGEIVIPKPSEENEILFPVDVKETLYLLIPKEELPNDLPINGEIELKSEIIELE